MAHLTDKPMGLVKMQRELSAAQAENDRLRAAGAELELKNQQLEEEIARLKMILSKKGKKAADRDE